MNSFEDFLKNKRDKQAVKKLKEAEAQKELERHLLLFEYEIYKSIPGTESSYREDKANTNTRTPKHVHVYAKPKGSGRELYSASVNGRGHDGSRGIEIPARHGDYFRSLGYEIPLTNILECEDLAGISADEYILIAVHDFDDAEEI